MQEYLLKTISALLLILMSSLILISCDKKDENNTSSYIVIDEHEWQLDLGYYKLYTRTVNERTENWHQLALYSQGISEDEEALSGSGVFVHMHLHPLDSNSIVGHYSFKDGFVNDGTSASEVFPSISILSPDSTITYGDLKTGTTCEVSLTGEEYQIRMEGYIIEWKAQQDVWVEDSIPFSLYYEGELEEK